MVFFVLIACLFVAALCFGSWMLRWQFARAEALLEGWAAQNRLRIVHKARANVGDGPGGTRQSSKQVKYRVVVVDESGAQRSGVAHLGSRAMGTLSDEVSVEWDR